MNAVAWTGMAVLALVGLLVGWLLGGRAANAGLERLRAERETLVADRTKFQTQADELRHLVEEQKVELENLRSQRTELTTEAARADEQLKAAQTLLADERESFATAMQQLPDTFQGLAAKALKDNNAHFFDLADRQFQAKQEAIDTLLTPVKEKLDELNVQTQQLESKREGAYEKLGQQLLQLDTDQKSLKDAATALSSALRNTRTTGKWGEIVLHRVVELAGMTEHCDYTQQHTQNDNRPDMVVRLPNGRTIIVDAKTSISSFLDASNAQDEATQQQKLKEHAKNVRAHAHGLAGRRYERAFEDAIDMTICFIPGDVYYYAALQIDPKLFEDAANEKIIFATPTTLIALLKAAAFGWQQDASRREAKEILKQAQEVYERLTTATGYFKSLGGCLDGSVESYNKLLGSLEGRVFPAARRMKDLGISGNALPSIEPIDKTTRPTQAKDWQSRGPSNGIALAAEATAEEASEE